MKRDISGLLTAFALFLLVIAVCHLTVSSSEFVYRIASGQLEFFRSLTANKAVSVYFAALVGTAVTFYCIFQNLKQK